jgi:hypothetical protein
MPQLEPRLPLERARECEGGTETAWCADYQRGGVPGQGVVVEQVKKGKQPLSCLKYTKTAPNMGGFPHLLTYKSLKMPLFPKNC